MLFFKPPWDLGSFKIPYWIKSYDVANSIAFRTLLQNALCFNNNLIFPFDTTIWYLKDPYCIHEDEVPYPLEYSPTLEYNLTPFQKSCFWAFSWIEPHFLVKKSPFWGIFWIEPHPKTHIEKYNPVVILERIRYVYC